MRPRHAATTILAALAVAALAPAASYASDVAHSAQAAATASFTADARVFTDNIGSGSECNPLNKSNGYHCLKYVNQQIASFRPDAISIDEACKTDKYAFKKEHPHWDSVFKADAASTPNKCGKGVQHGNFIAAPKLTKFFALKLTNVPVGSRTMYLSCARAASFWICTVHLPSGNGVSTKEIDKVHTAEIKEIANRVEQLPGKVAVCGDFNMRPSNPAFDAFKAKKFKETDPADQATTRNDGKFDYIWYHEHNNAHVSAVRATVVKQPNDHFEHDLLEGRVHW